MMSFNAQNLSYGMFHPFHIMIRITDWLIEPQEPAFLRRLRGNGAGDTGRHERPIARPRKPKDPKELEDDGPVYVDEQSQNVVTKEAYEALISKTEPATPDVGESSGLEATEDRAQKGTTDQSSTQNQTPRGTVAVIGGSTKRRLAKVVVDDEEAKDAPRFLEGAVTTGKRVKKGKKVKLSFDDAQ